MPDVPRSLRLLDDLEVPDHLWAAAERRTPRPSPPEPPRRRAPAVVLALVVSAASIAFLVRAAGDGAPPAVPSPGTSSSPGGGATEPRLQADTVVLQAKDGPPMLCLGGILTSLPPQCGDVPVTNWDWDAVDGEERMSGVRWGAYHVVGTYDGERFTLTRVPQPMRTTPGPEADEIVTPCDEPAGGWVATDPHLAADADLDRTTRAAQREPDFSGAWVDGIPTVLTLAFTGDLERHETEVRRTWGGPLCLWTFDRTFRELRRIQDEIQATGAELGLHLLGTSVAVYRNQVDVDVVLADGEALRELERRYGRGTVRVTSALRPAD